MKPKNIRKTTPDDTKVWFKSLLHHWARNGLGLLYNSWGPHMALMCYSTAPRARTRQNKEGMIQADTCQQKVCSLPQSTDLDRFIRCWLFLAPAPPSPLVDVIGRVNCCDDELSVFALRRTARPQPGYGHHFISGFVSTNA